MIKIVTDSSCDIPQECIEKLGITVVPIHFIFGLEDFRDGEISPEEFYKKLTKGKISPSTAAPSTEEFSLIYEKLLKEADELISIHITGKLSRVCESAIQASKKFGGRIRVINSNTAAMALGFLVMEAANLALAKNSSAREIEALIKKNIENNKVKIRAILDSLEYAKKGGRVGDILIEAARKASMFFGLKPIISFKDGKVVLAGVVRPIDKIKKIIDFIKTSDNLEAIAIEYSSEKEEAQKAVIAVKSAFPKIPVYLSTLSLAVGCHAGPNVLAVVVKERAT
jgi:DegV family protein with EDD domain